MTVEEILELQTIGRNRTIAMETFDEIEPKIRKIWNLGFEIALTHKNELELFYRDDPTKAIKPEHREEENEM